MLMKKLILMSVMTLIGHCVLAQTPSYVLLNGNVFLSEKAKVLQDSMSLSTVLPV